MILTTLICIFRYVKSEEKEGQFLADTSCEKLPVNVCGAGCSYVDGEEECHDKVITTIINVPEEICDLNPQKSCRLSTKLVPKLEPVRECTIVPKETCRLVFNKPKVIKKPLKTVWCLDQSEEQLPPETEKTSDSFISPERRTNLSEIQVDNEIDNALEANNVETDLNNLPLDENQNSRPSIDLDDFDNEITIENEFVQLKGNTNEDTEAFDFIPEYDFGQDLIEEQSESQTNPIITVGLAATSPPLNTRARQRKNIVLNRRLSVPARINPQKFKDDSLAETNGYQGLDPRIGLPSLQFLRVKENEYDVINNIIGPQIPSNGLRDQFGINQNMFQTRFYK